MLILMKAHGTYKILGQTRDDAAGEAFDKIARALNLGYPGGPIIDRMSTEGDEHSIVLPRAFLGKDNFDFSFSGLKTAVLKHIYRESSELNVANLIASFQEAVVDVLIKKTLNAALANDTKTVMLAGGVAANSKLRRDLERKAQELDIALCCPPPELCTDNAAMVACAGYYKLLRDEKDDLELETIANLRLGQLCS